MAMEGDGGEFARAGSEPSLSFQDDVDAPDSVKSLSYEFSPSSSSRGVRRMACLVDVPFGMGVDEDFSLAFRSTTGRKDLDV